MRTPSFLERKKSAGHFYSNLKLIPVIALGYKADNAYSWSNSRSPNIPMFEQALDLAVAFDFDVREFIKEIM